MHWEIAAITGTSFGVKGGKMGKRALLLSRVDGIGIIPWANGSGLGNTHVQEGRGINLLGGYLFADRWYYG